MPWILAIASLPHRPSSAPWARPAVLALALLACGLASSCSKKGSAPVVPLYTLSGRLREAGTLTDGAGAPTGQRVVQNADGVRVLLYKDAALTDSTQTVAGAYHFRVALGTYFAVARLGATFADSTAQLHVHDADRGFPDTLKLDTASGLTLYPNPFVATLHVHYTLASTGPVKLEVLDATGTRVRLLTDQSLSAGPQTADWDGLGEASTPLSAGTFWLLLRAGGTATLAPAFRDGLPVSGPMTMVLRSTDEIDTPLGLLNLTDVGGVRVRLYSGGTVVDSALTTSGRYELAAPTPGTYRVGIRAAGAPETQSADLAVGSTGLVVTDPIVVSPFPDLDNYPNPFASSHGVGIEFTLATSQPVTARVFTMDGRLVWSYDYGGVNGPAGLNHIHWIGSDNSNVPVANGYYWAGFQAGAVERYNLVRKE